MGKHNGKARKSGLSVGSALVNRARKDGRTGSAAAYLYTTEPAQKNNMQSVIEANDLDEMMQMADLAGKDFTAEKQHIIVISTGGTAATVDHERVAAERREAEERSRHRLRLPRRPDWDESTTADQLEEQERASFYEWRRDLASLEQDERLVLTPFEKNLEVWRQLWRVLERSDVVVQVVDARDPLTYRSEDLERYARDLHATKASLLLLNKADLLPEALRAAWADYFDGLGLDYVFWSARAGMDEHSTDEDVRAAAVKQRTASDPRARLLGVDELLELLEQRAAKAAAEGEVQGVGRASRGERLVVGLTGYPNVGKSSTINALFGSKKTAVAPTPGKTKHFQTLNVTSTLCLCDCPGLVMPQFAQSKAEMVAAGVIPIDRLTDVRAPVEAVGARVGRDQLEAVYGIHLPAPARGEDPSRPPTAMELLRAFAFARGWVTGSGLPDETRAGRLLLKDYVDGKILYCKAPPGASPEVVALAAAAGQRKRRAAPAPQAAAAGQAQQQQQQAAGAAAAGAQQQGAAAAAAAAAGEEQQQQAEGSSSGGAGAGGSGAAAAKGQAEGEAAGLGLELDEGDLLLIDDLDIGGRKAKQQRPAYKFHKKQVRTKGDRGLKKDPLATFDGAAIVQGKRGGVVRVPVPSA